MGRERAEGRRRTMSACDVEAKGDRRSVEHDKRDVFEKCYI